MNSWPRIQNVNANLYTRFKIIITILILNPKTDNSKYSF